MNIKLNIILRRKEFIIIIVEVEQCDVHLI